MSTPITALPDGPVLLDGGMGQEILKRTTGPEGTSWSHLVVVDQADVVRAVHDDYIQAGARVITTNSYTLTRPRLEPVGLGHRFAELNRRAGELAAEARDASGRAVRVAGSLPPQEGSYLVRRALSFDDTVGLYREQAEILAPHVDLFLCETVASAEEARAAVTGAASVGKPVWVALTLEDHGSPLLRSGETVEEAARALDGLPVEAFLANCCSPESITAAMPALAKLGTAGGYANGFVAIPDKWTETGAGLDRLGRRDIDPETYLGHVQAWLEAGAKIVGGCCEIGPAHIARLHEALTNSA
ncbi:MAG: homocysteine S-methyltransferase family protein [Geminicoccaceae bacterium]|nr:homocysteine S-methyltransferase family protein [Geminicoccaceae bacterium]